MATWLLAELIVVQIFPTTFRAPLTACTPADALPAATTTAPISAPDKVLARPIKQFVHGDLAGLIRSDGNLRECYGIVAVEDHVSRDENKLQLCTRSWNL